MTTVDIRVDYWSSLAIYKFIIILDFGPTKPNNDSVGYLCRQDHVLLLIYCYADNQFQLENISMSKHEQIL